MDIEKIEIELNTEEQNLLSEIKELQNKMNDVDPEKLNGQLMDAIQKKSIETITMALGVSDILENTAHSTNGLNLKKEYKEYQNWENTPSTERSFKYKPKYTTGNEFDKLLKKDVPKYNRADYVGKGPGLSQAETQKKKWKESQIKGGINDAYTGKFIKNGEKDKTKAYEWEHVKSAKEVSEDRVLNYALSKEEKRDFLNSEENLVPIRGEINNQKRAVKLENIEEWKNAPSKKYPGKSNKEAYEIDDKIMGGTIEESKRKEDEILKNKVINKGIASKSKIAASNAVKSGAKAAVGKLLSITAIEVINEFKKKEEVDFKTKATNITKRIKEKSKEILSSFKDHSLNSFLSTFIDALLNSVFKIAKNIFKFVKTAFMSILKAIKILFSNEYSWEVRLQEAMKLIGATVVTLIGLALDEIIGNAMITYLPFTAPFAGYVSPVLSGLIVGIGSVLILQGFQKYQSKIEFNKLIGAEANSVQKLSRVNLAQAAVSDVKTTKSVGLSLTIFQGTLPIIESCKNQINESLRDLSEIKKEIDNKSKNITNSQNEADDLLDQLKFLS